MKEINFVFVFDPLTAEIPFVAIYQHNRNLHGHYFIFHQNQYSSVNKLGISIELAQVIKARNLALMFTWIFTMSSDILHLSKAYKSLS